MTEPSRSKNEENVIFKSNVCLCLIIITIILLFVTKYKIFIICWPNNNNKENYALDLVELKYFFIFLIYIKGI